MIEVQNLTKEYGRFRAVDDLSFRVAPGEVLGFLGPNGAGKTTTMRIVAGFLPATAGRVRVCGADIETQAVEAKRRIGYLPEGAPSYPEMTPRSFLEFIADARGIPPAQRRQRLDAVFQQLHLEGVLEQTIDTLSKGYRRRVGLAQAILHDPEVLILDEPTDGLDPNQKHEVRNLIRELGKSKAVVFSTHILEEVDAACSRAIIIDRGKIVAQGTPNELRARSRLEGAVTLQADGATAEKLSALGRVEDFAGAFRIYPRDPSHGPELAAAVIELVNREGWKVHGMYSERGELDEVFRSLTQPDTAAA